MNILQKNTVFSSMYQRSFPMKIQYELKYNRSCVQQHTVSLPLRYRYGSTVSYGF
jgi:hypothetical protein